MAFWPEYSQMLGGVNRRGPTRRLTGPQQRSGAALLGSVSKRGLDACARQNGNDIIVFPYARNVQGCVPVSVLCGSVGTSL